MFQLLIGKKTQEVIPIPSKEITKMEEEKQKLKEAMDGLIALLEEKKKQGNPMPEVQQLVENAMTALLFGDVVVAEEILNEAAGKIGIAESGQEPPPEEESEELPPPDEIEALIAFFAEKLEDCVKRGLNTEKTLDILVQAQEAFEKGDLETAWRAARTGIKAFEMEMEIIEEERKSKPPPKKSRRRRKRIPGNQT
jgi:hypothetical protein